MTNRIRSKHIGLAAIGCGVLGASIYLAMIHVTLDRIAATSGQIPFDMRPFGYVREDAITLLDALGAKGRTYYVTRQIPLDTLYPALLALTLISTISWFGQRTQNRRFVRLGIIVSVGAALFDYLENLGIIAMIWTWPNPSALLVQAASMATVFKSILTTTAMCLALITGLHWARALRSNFEHT